MNYKAGDGSLRDQRGNDSKNKSDVSHLAHYYDEQGKPLPQWESIWDKLNTYFGSATPAKIIIKYKPNDPSQFNTQNDSILLSPKAKESVEVIAHESAHLCMAHLTNGASVMEQFRFFDEGYVEIIGLTIAGQSVASYKTNSLLTAAIQNKKNNVSFAKVQKWSEYFGTDWFKANQYAYPVGSSFIYFIVDTYGEKKLGDFFWDIGQTTDLNQTCKNVFNKTADEIEKQWLDYLAKIPIDETPPKVIEMFPSHNATEVPTNLSEIYVKFNVAMMPIVHVLTPCQDTGVCYTNAYWKDEKTLAIKVINNLKAGYNYDLQLGSTSGKLASATDVPLPITPWYFTTQK